MATYEFQADDGAVIERQYPMSEAPDLGTPIEHEGKTYRRVVSAEINKNTAEWFRPGVTRCLPRNAPGFKHDSEGRPIVESRAQLDAYRKRVGLEMA